MPRSIRPATALGTVVAVHNFGAGDLIEVRPVAGGKTQLLPFDEATVPAVDIAAGRIVVVRRKTYLPGRAQGTRPSRGK